MSKKKIVQTEGQNINLRDLIIYHFIIQENPDSIVKNMMSLLQEPAIPRAFKLLNNSK